MDYGNGTHLAQWQWRSIHDPAVVKGLFKRDEEGKVLSNSIFNEEDLLLYESIIKNITKFKLFNVIYSYITNSNEWVELTVERGETEQERKELLEKGLNRTNGYFTNAEDKTEWSELLYFENPFIIGGSAKNPHKIVLFYPGNYKLLNEEIVGDGLKNPTTIFEEFFHAAHYLYLKSKGKNLEDKIKFFTQTEVEVELIEAFAYYLVLDDFDKFGEIFPKELDAYNFAIDKMGMLKEDVGIIFENITKNRFISDEHIKNLRNNIINLFNNKKNSSPGYQKMNYDKLDYSFEFTKYLIDQYYNGKD